VHGPLHVRGAICLVNSDNERDMGPILDLCVLVFMCFLVAALCACIISPHESACKSSLGDGLHLSSRKLHAITGQ
jgi:hypothetical protein